MAVQKTRRCRHHLNYRLGTEPEAYLEELFQGRIEGVYVGLWPSLSEQHHPPVNAEIVAGESHGGPLLIAVGTINKTWVVSSDQILRSMVMRRVDSVPANPDFLRELYAGENDAPDYLKAKEVVDLSKEFGLTVPQPLVEIRIYKLPDNYDRAVSRTIYSPHQCAIELVFEETQFLLGYRMDSSRKDHRFLSWDDLSDTFPRDEMTVCLNLSMNGKGQIVRSVV